MSKHELDPRPAFTAGRCLAVRRAPPPRFTTIYPGWYTGRAVHIRFKLRLSTGLTTSHDFTPHFVFDASLTEIVHAQSPYSTKVGAIVSIPPWHLQQPFRRGKDRTELQATANEAGGYDGNIDLGVRLA